jgi:hypothetical protein
MPVECSQLVQRVKSVLAMTPYPGRPELFQY